MAKVRKSIRKFMDQNQEIHVPKSGHALDILGYYLEQHLQDEEGHEGYVDPNNGSLHGTELCLHLVFILDAIRQLQRQDKTTEEDYCVGDGLEGLRLDQFEAELAKATYGAKRQREIVTRCYCELPLI